MLVSFVLCMHRGWGQAQQDAAVPACEEKDDEAKVAYLNKALKSPEQNFAGEREVTDQDLKQVWPFPIFRPAGIAQACMCLTGFELDG